MNKKELEEFEELASLIKDHSFHTSEELIEKISDFVSQNNYVSVNRELILISYSHKIIYDLVVEIMGIFEEKSNNVEKDKNLYKSIILNTIEMALNKKFD